MAIESTDNIITAWAERCHGPGWSNFPIWVLVRGTDGKIRQECLQPEEQTQEMHTLFDVSYQSHLAMKYAVDSWRMRKNHGQ